jgi:glucokinase
MLLAGDVGGTKTRLIFYTEQGQALPDTESTYTSSDYPHLLDILRLYIQKHRQKLSRVVVGMPGPVNEGVVRVTNLHWVVSEAELSAGLGGVHVKLLNDLEATAYGLEALGQEDLEVINEGLPNPAGNKAVIAPGTGLGEAILFHYQGRHIASASEGGHADFAPRNLFEIKLLRYMMGKFGHVSYERLCSGLGIPYIYKFLRKSYPGREHPEVAEAIANTADPTPIIVQAALEYRSELCVEALDAFVSILGSEAGNMARTVLASGGVYLGGGIPPKILPAIKDATFMTAFTDKGRFADFLRQTPVYVVLNEKTALLGSAQYGLKW